MLYTLLILLHFGMLVYHTYKVVAEQCLPTVSSGVTRAMDVSENVHIVRVNIYHSDVVLQHQNM